MRVLATGIAIAAVIFLNACEEASPTSPLTKTAIAQPDISLQVCKWRGDRTAAVSPTYDAPFWEENTDTVLALVKENGLTMDFEFVTAEMQKPEFFGYLERARTDLLPNDIHFFAHGHHHFNHDTLTYEEARASFSTCYTLMQQWGINPRVYAYPGGRGLEQETQQACKDAGFLAGRGSGISFPHEREKFFQCSNEKMEPLNWFDMRAIPMGRQSDACIEDHGEMAGIIDEAIDSTAWVILMYHSIGSPGGWSWYPVDEFAEDMTFLRTNSSVWVDNYDDIAVYIKERNRVDVHIEEVTEGEARYRVHVNDWLDDVTYNQALTFRLRVNVRDGGYSRAQIEREGDPTYWVDLGSDGALVDLMPHGKDYIIKLL